MKLPRLHPRVFKAGILTQCVLAAAISFFVDVKPGYVAGQAVPIAAWLIAWRVFGCRHTERDRMWIRVTDRQQNYLYSTWLCEGCGELAPQQRGNVARPKGPGLRQLIRWRS